MKKHIVALLQLLPVCLSLLLLAAHFFRHSQLLLIGVCFGLLGALLIRHPATVKVVQGALLLAAVEWLRTAYLLVAARMAEGYPWTRLACILAVVVLLNIASIFVFRCKNLQERYRL